ncbi:MAG: sulfite exporter TauE/SafE family protein [Candidatus Eremiobacteraeota bacterium]|nr:sulfite exporter TauE/SafE family protein [Candidatus Eremiobacteraeota bacterium]
MLLVGVAAFVASAINAGAGGGSFISFPVLLATGVPSVSANATNNVAMWLGSFASAGSFRSELDVPRETLVKMIVASAIGSLAGAVILLRTSNERFSSLIPFLLLASTTLFICGPWLTKRSRSASGELSIDSPFGLGLQFAIGIYGGFFGAAIGILMLALLGILGMSDLRRANAFKLLLATVINGVAVVPFVIARAVAWEAALAMSAGAIAGGFLGAGVVKRMPPAAVRGFVILVGISMTAYFFWKTYA